MFDDAEQVLGLAPIYLGLDPDTANPDELQKAVDVSLGFSGDMHIGSRIANIPSGPRA